MVKPFWYALLFAILVGPFLLREIAGELEIYPAVLMPVGARLTQLSDSVVLYPEFEVFAVTAGGTTHRMNAKELLGTLPSSYLIAQLTGSFGLIARPYPTRWRNWFEREKKWTPQERQQTITWLRSRAEVLGYSDVIAIRVRKSLKKVDTNSGAVSELKEFSSYDISLVDEPS